MTKLGDFIFKKCLLTVKMFKNQNAVQEIVSLKKLGIHTFTQYRIVYLPQSENYS